MAVEVPYAARPDDVTRLLKVLPTIKVPAGKVDARYIKSLGFAPVSSGHLLNILRMLGFIDEKEKPSATWLAYVADERRGLVLASAVKKAYADLFKSSFCPYLEEDGEIMDYLKRSVKASPRERVLMVKTFRYLSEPADFQDMLCELESDKLAQSKKEEEAAPNIKVNPNLQLNIQVHIDPDTPDEKIETIFKNMRKYLLGKEDATQ
jgi:hypothetical protein